MTKLYCKKIQEYQIIDNDSPDFIEMAIKVWVKHHNERNTGKRITKRDITIWTGANE